MRNSHSEVHARVRVKMAALRWGICGCGIIANEFKLALDALPEEERGRHRVVAVSARSLERARQFAQKHNVPAAYGSYDELCADKDVQAVYVSTINSTHYEIALKAIKNGKHVLVEKVMTLSSAHTEALYRAAEEQGVFVLDGMWTRFFPASIKLCEMLKAGAIGEVQYCHAEMAFTPHDTTHWDIPRLLDAKHGGGALFDVGVYPLYFASMVFGGEEPEVVSACSELADCGTDRVTAITLKYKGGRMAQISCGIGYDSPREATIVGQKGAIKVPFPFWCPKRLILPSGEELKFPSEPPSQPPHPCNLPNSWGLQYEAEEMRRCIEAGKKEADCMSWRESLMMAKIMDNIHNQIGSKFDI